MDNRTSITVELNDTYKQLFDLQQKLHNPDGKRVVRAELNSFRERINQLNILSYRTSSHTEQIQQLESHLYMLEKATQDQSIDQLVDISQLLHQRSKEMNSELGDQNTLLTSLITNTEKTSVKMHETQGRLEKLITESSTYGLVTTIIILSITLVALIILL
jgi:hypothetical protein